MQKSKMAVWGGLTNICERREAKSKGEKERHTHLNTEFQRLARRDKKAFLSYRHVADKVFILDTITEVDAGQSEDIRHLSKLVRH